MINFSKCLYCICETTTSKYFYFLPSSPPQILLLYLFFIYASTFILTKTLEKGGRKTLRNRKIYPSPKKREMKWHDKGHTERNGLRYNPHLLNLYNIIPSEFLFWVGKTHGIYKMKFKCILEDKHLTKDSYVLGLTLLVASRENLSFLHWVAFAAWSNMS